MFNKILKVLNVITQVILLIAAIISMLTAYVVFAPDDLPKPFRLVYDTTNAVPVAAFGAVVAITPTPTPEPKHYLPGEGIMIDLSTKIINLVDPGGRKYIRLTIVVEFAPDNPEYDTLPEEEKTAYLTEFEAKLNARLPIMDDTVITLLSTKTYEDLYTADGKEKLRQEIMDILSQKLPDLKILSIYFTEFVVQ
ncbi:MAG: flagellar basal body-associated FliL family protein [Chloroflexi bacterium]|nr:flagellar basal body-associated FliL family protein [Chloroflexota bacterium]